MEDRKITCIMCPNGCPLTVRFKNDGTVEEITGNSCPRGYDYAFNEVHHPVRTLTSTVKTEGGRILAVKSSSPVPKELLFDIMAEINRARPADSLAFGDVVIAKVCGCDADIVVTSD